MSRMSYRTRKIVCRTSRIGSRTSKIGWRYLQCMLCKKFRSKYS
jgi:hypothetical protein